MTKNPIKDMENFFSQIFCETILDFINIHNFKMSNRLILNESLLQYNLYYKLINRVFLFNNITLQKDYPLPYHSYKCDIYLELKSRQLYDS